MLEDRCCYLPLIIIMHVDRLIMTPRLVDCLETNRGGIFEDNAENMFKIVDKWYMLLCLCSHSSCIKNLTHCLRGICFDVADIVR